MKTLFFKVRTSGQIVPFQVLTDLKACGGILEPSWDWKHSLARPFWILCNEAFILPSKYLPTTNQRKTHQRRLSRPFFIIMMIISSKNLSGSWGHVTSRPHNRTWGREMESGFLDLHVLRATERPLTRLQSQIIWRLSYACFIETPPYLLSVNTVQSQTKMQFAFTLF